MHPEISIIVPTYNQVETISKCLDSILAQDFKLQYEVIIHDDCSTDGTTEIVKRYVSRYADKLKLILPSRNQYSDYVSKPFFNCLMEAKGKYIAICEGDDYWVSRDKLSAQYEIMEANASDLSFHPVYRVSNNTITKPSQKYETRIYTLKETFAKGHHFVPTCSLMFKNQGHLEKYHDYYRRAPAGDVLHRIICGQGGLLCIPSLYGAYRVEHTGSWSDQMKVDEDARAKMWIQWVQLFDELLEQCQFEKDSLRYYRARLIRDIIIDYKIFENSSKWCTHFEAITGMTLSIHNIYAILPMLRIMLKFKRKINVICTS